MFVLVVNCGSSSLKAAVLDPHSGKKCLSAKGERLGESGATLRVNGDQIALPDGADHKVALEKALPLMLAAIPEGEKVSGVGHRVVHGGVEFKGAVRIDDAVVEAIEALIPLAPLHNPANLRGIRAARELLPDVPHVAVFDTAFHATMPRRAKEYALPKELREKHGLQRFGFHGPSHQYVATIAAKYLNADVRDLRIITCHLGNGASVCAVEYGRSIETSMGMTPLEGLVMGTRSGDVDPGLLIQVMRAEGWGPDELDNMLNRESGLAGLSTVGNDVRDIEERAADGDEDARLALHVFAHRVRKYIGAYAATMGGVDAIVFTAGIGQNSAFLRNKIAQRLDFLGARLDSDANRSAKVTTEAPVVEISTRHARARLLVAKTNEELAIAKDVARLVMELDQLQNKIKPIPVAVSARHVHLAQSTVEELFGEGYQLTERNPLSQPGQFACNETVTLVGPKREIKKVRILGPARSKNQIEVSRTDEFTLGIDAPVRASGDVKNSPGITLRAGNKEVTLDEGVICAWRHIHMTPEDAEAYGVKDKDVVEVAVQSNGRSLIFGDVLVRVKSSYKLEMHIDTDEGNAAELQRGAVGSLVPTEGQATLRKRRTRFDAV